MFPYLGYKMRCRWKRKFEGSLVAREVKEKINDPLAGVGTAGRSIKIIISDLMWKRATRLLPVAPTDSHF